MLTYEEIAEAVEVFLSLGVENRFAGRRRADAQARHRDAGGEAGARPRAENLRSTTNGFNLASGRRSAKAAGLDRVTTASDSLRTERFREIRAWTCSGACSKACAPRAASG